MAYDRVCTDPEKTLPLGKYAPYKMLISIYVVLPPPTHSLDLSLYVSYHRLVYDLFITRSRSRWKDGNKQFGIIFVSTFHREAATGGAVMLRVPTVVKIKRGSKVSTIGSHGGSYDVMS